MIDSRRLHLPLCLLTLAVLSQALPGWTESRTFVIQETKRGHVNKLDGGWLDLSEMKKPAPPPVVYQAPVREMGVVGLDLRLVANEYPMVQAVFRGAPAHQKGILPGDSIIAINGFTTMGRSRSEVDAMISDVPGEKVEFTVARGPQIKRISVTVMGVDEASAEAFLNP